jgi:hypothetical protein
MLVVAKDKIKYLFYKTVSLSWKMQKYINNKIMDKNYHFNVKKRTLSHRQNSALPQQISLGFGMGIFWRIIFLFLLKKNKKIVPGCEGIRQV